MLQVERRLILPLGRVHHRPKRIYEYQAWRIGFHLVGDARQHAVEIATDEVDRQIDEADRVIDLVDIKKRKLLLIAQHLQRGFAEYRKEQRALIRGCQREHHLVGEGGFAAARCARNQVKREFREPAAKQIVQAEREVEGSRAFAASLLNAVLGIFELNFSDFFQVHIFLSLP